MKRILFLYHTSSIGGGSYCLLNILKSIDRLKIEPVVLLCNPGPLTVEIEALGISVYYLSTMRVVPYNASLISVDKLKSVVDILYSFSEFKRILKTVNPSVVYCNTMMLYPYLRIAKSKGYKTIIHIREHWPENQHRYQRYFALHNIAKFADEIIAINTYSKSILEPFGRNPTIVYDWIDLSSRFEEHYLSDIFHEDMSDKRTFLYMGGMQEIKGAYEVLLAFTKYLSDKNYRLLVLGIDSNYKTKGFRGFIKKIFSFLGRKTYSEKVLDLINSDSRIKCISSIYNIKHLYEQVYCILSFFTIPHANLALAESVICNVVNVAALSEESLEYSLNGKLACLYEANNFNDFVSKLQNIEVIHHDYLYRMSKYSYKIADLFNPQRNIDVLNKVLNNI